MWVAFRLRALDKVEYKGVRHSYLPRGSDFPRLIQSRGTKNSTWVTPRTVTAITVRCEQPPDRAQRPPTAPNESRNPPLRRMRRTFFGDMERHSATLDIFLPSRSQTLGITISANSSVTC